MNQQQRESARHALGLPNARNCSYRNRYWVSAGAIGFEAWCGLVSTGDAIMETFESGRTWFHLTIHGARQALDPKETLDKEDFMTTEQMTFGYLNHKGSYSERTIEHPVLYFGVTEYHKTPQWLVAGHCVKHDARRDFAQKDMIDPNVAKLFGELWFESCQRGAGRNWAGLPDLEKKSIIESAFAAAAV